MSEAPHKPVMLQEMLQAVKPQDEEIYVDATFGAGGYSRALLESAECRVYAIDRDPNTVMLADALARDFPGRFLFLAGKFSDMVTLLEREGVRKVHGIVMDIGVSSMQIDQPQRGFSFRHDGPLDMRMGDSGVPASVLVNELDEAELADIIYHYGEERASRAIARAVVAARAEAPIETTVQLAKIVRSVVRSKDIDPATRTFQALRIKVNDELGELEKALESAAELLVPGGRLVVVTFHSLEDRIVKRFMRPKSAATSRHDMAALVEYERRAGGSEFDLPFKKAILASAQEQRENPRARSAKLRMALRREESHKRTEPAL